MHNIEQQVIEGLENYFGPTSVHIARDTLLRSDLSASFADLARIANSLVAKFGVEFNISAGMAWITAQDVINDVVKRINEKTGKTAAAGTVIKLTTPRSLWPLHDDSAWH